MPAAPTYNDGTIPYGSVVITSNVVTYIADDWSVSDGSKRNERTNQWGEVTGAFAIPTVRNGSATVQIATAATALLAPGASFTVTTASPSDANTYLIDTADTPAEKEGYLKQRITFHKKIN